MPIRRSPDADADADCPRPLFSRYYARLSERMESAGLAELRSEVLWGLRGTVVEVGAGNGMNFSHYASGVAQVDAVEPEPYLRGRAERAAAAAGVPVRVHAGRAEALPLPDGSADAAVLCLVLCSFPDPTTALAEVRRVLRPGGELRFLEHTVSDAPGLRSVQRCVDATFWPRLAGGCHTARDPVRSLSDAGFEITRVRRLRFPDTRIQQPASPHVLGAARAPMRPD